MRDTCSNPPILSMCSSCPLLWTAYMCLDAPYTLSSDGKLHGTRVTLTQHVYTFAAIQKKNSRQNGKYMKMKKPWKNAPWYLHQNPATLQKSPSIHVMVFAPMGKVYPHTIGGAWAPPPGRPFLAGKYPWGTPARILRNLVETSWGVQPQRAAPGPPRTFRCPISCEPPPHNSPRR